MLQYYKCNIIQALPNFSYQNRFPYLKGFFTSTAYVVLNIVNSTLFVTFLLIKKFLHVSRCWGVRALVLWVTESLKSPHYHSECCHTLLLSIRVIRQQSASGISRLHTWHFGAIPLRNCGSPAHEKSNDITAVPSVQMSIIKNQNARLTTADSSGCQAPAHSLRFRLWSSLKIISALMAPPRAEYDSRRNDMEAQDWEKSTHLNHPHKQVHRKLKVRYAWKASQQFQKELRVSVESTHPINRDWR